MNNLNLKTIVPAALVLFEIFLIFTSRWAYIAISGVPTDKISTPFEYGIALITSITILVYIWRKKEHLLANFVLIGCFITFLIRAKVLGITGVDNIKDYVDFSVEMTSRFWTMLSISIVMLIVDVIFLRMTKSTQANQAN